MILTRKVEVAKIARVSSDSRDGAEIFRGDHVTDQVFMPLFGTGFRNRSVLSYARVTIGGVSVETLYAGPQGDFVGLDQGKVRLPRSLTGRSKVDVVLIVDDKMANTMRVAIR